METKYTYTQDQKGRSGNSWTRGEERRFKAFDTNKAYREKER